MQYSIIIIIFVILLQFKTASACFGGLANCYYPEPFTEVIFTQNSFTIDSSTRIDSLFFALSQEIEKLPTHGWYEYESYEKLELRLPNLSDLDTFHIIQEKNYGDRKKYINAKLRDCPQIVIPSSLFYILNETERVNIYNAVKNISKYKSSPLIARDTIAIDDFNYPDDRYTACSIYASIDKNPTGEYILSLNNTNYKMVKLSENHYVLRKEEE